jgi:hypothetical protein
MPELRFEVERAIDRPNPLPYAVIVVPPDSISAMLVKDLFWWDTDEAFLSEAFERALGGAEVTKAGNSMVDCSMDGEKAVIQSMYYDDMSTTVSTEELYAAWESWLAFQAANERFANPS